MKLIHTLEIREGPDKGVKLELNRRETVLGREPDCTLPLNDPQISRRHAKVVVHKRKVKVMDQASTNGLIFDGTKVEQANLVSGDEFQIGDTIIRLTSGEVDDEKSDKVKKKRLAVKAAKPTRGSLPIRVMTTAIALVLFTGIGVTWPLYSGVKSDLKAEALKRASVLTLALGALNTDAIRRGADMMVSVDYALTQEGVIRAYIYDAHGRVLAPASRFHETPSDSFTHKVLAANGLVVQQIDDDRYDLARPIRILNEASGDFEKAGAVRIIVSLSRMAGARTGVAGALVLAVGPVLALALLAGWFLIRSSRRPIEKLRQDLEDAVRGESQSVKAGDTLPGLDELAESINRCLAKIAALRTSQNQVQVPSKNTTGSTSDGCPEQLQAVMDVLPEPVLVIDSVSLVRQANPAAKAAFGSGSGEFLGNHILEAIPNQELLAFVLQLIKESVESGGGAIERAVALADGKDVELRVSVITSIDGQGDFIALSIKNYGD